MLRHDTVLMKSLAGAWLLAVFAGCGESVDPSYRPVTGIVLVDGSPLADAVVAFTPEQGSTASGRTDETGRYTLFYAARRVGARVGNNRVVITKEAPFRVARSEADAITEEEGELLPPRYNTQTELSATVEDTGKNVIDFELTLK